MKDQLGVAGTQLLPPCSIPSKLWLDNEASLVFGPVAEAPYSSKRIFKWNLSSIVKVHKNAHVLHKVYNSRLIHYIESGAGFFIKYGKQWTLGMQRFVDLSQRISKGHLTSFLQ